MTIPLTILDLVVLLLLLGSAALAAYRGATREVLSIGAWVGAAVGMFLLSPRLTGLVETFLQPAILAAIATYIAVFLLLLLPLSYFSFRISESVRDSAVGPVDRILGFLFGALRALVVLGIAYVVYVAMIGGTTRMPSWLADSRTKPLLSATGDLLVSLLPEKYRPASTSAKPDGKAAEPEEERIGGSKPAAAPEPAAAPGQGGKPQKPKPQADDKEASHGYGARERNALDQLVRSATGAGRAGGEAANGSEDPEAKPQR